MTNDVKNIFMYIINIHIFSFVRYLLKFVVHIFLVLLMNFKSSIFWLLVCVYRYLSLAEN